MHNPGRHRLIKAVKSLSPKGWATAGGGAAVLVTAGSLLLTGGAGASVHATPSTTGAAIGTLSQAGYQASGRDFRFAQSTIPVPDIPSASGHSPAEYVELGSTTGFARIGITDDHDGSWELFAATGHTSLFGQHVKFAPLTGIPAGDGVTVSVYYNVGGNELFFNASDPNPAHTVLWAATAGAHGAIYTTAGALDDWDFTTTGVASPLPPWVAPFTINHFYGIALTTESGARGSMVGPWTTSPVSATSNGLLPPSGTTRVSPSALNSDGLSANGAVRANDHFTVNAVG